MADNVMAVTVLSVVRWRLARNQCWRPWPVRAERDHVCSSTAIALVASTVALGAAGWVLVADAGCARPRNSADRTAVARRAFSAGFAGARFSSSSSIWAACTASLYGLGYGRHERGARPRASVLPGVPGRHEPRRPRRRRVHVPADLGVHVARLVGAGHGAPPAKRQREGGLHLPADGELRHPVAAARLRSPGRPGRRLRLRCHPQRNALPGRVRRRSGCWR